jgi:beta-lactamase regulating signal transducer with metallopeptidase domain
VIERLLLALLAQTLALSVTVVSVRALQALCVRRLGAGAAYLCWLLVPVAMLCAALPHVASDALVLRVDVSSIASAWPGMAPRPHERAVGLLASLALAVWAAGALSLAATVARRQRRFDALVVRAHGASPRLPAGAGPAVIGVFRPRIAPPQDFERAFDDEQRRLVLMHEGVHLRRRDNAWNLLAVALLVVHWFNPVAWWAWRRLRVDQELACDAAVLRREPPESLAPYSAALLKVQGVALPPPLATAWHSTHPLVERIRMLQTHRISSARRRAGLRVAALGIVLAAIGGYALQAGADVLPAGNDQSVLTSIEMMQTAVSTPAQGVTDKSSVQSQMSVGARVGGEAIVRISGGGHMQPFELGLRVSRLDGNRLDVAMRLSAGTPLALLSSPRLIVREGEKARVSIDTGEKAGSFVISLTPKLVDRLPNAVADKAKASSAPPRPL